jgi:hypothetical protein
MHGFGILYFSDMTGVMNSKVCARTFTSAMVVAVFGMWHATHWLPGESFL